MKDELFQNWRRFINEDEDDPELAKIKQQGVEEQKKLIIEQAAKELKRRKTL